MKLIETYSAKTLNPTTLKPSRKFVYKFDSGNSCAFFDGRGWSYYSKTGALLNEKKEFGMRAIEAMKAAISAGMC